MKSDSTPELDPFLSIFSNIRQRSPYPLSLSELQQVQQKQKNSAKAKYGTVKTGNLRIGDIILLKFSDIQDNTKYTGFLSADGVFLDSVECISQSSNIEKGANVLLKSCLFRIEKARLTSSKKFDPFNYSDTEQTFTLGKPITYGDRIQIRHIHSGGFLTICKDAIAIEPGCLKICIGFQGNDSTWFEMKAMADLKNEGDCISYRDYIYLQPSCVDSIYYLHCDTSKIRLGQEKLEVNACMKPSILKPRLYMPLEEFKEDEEFITTGNGFRVYHRISEGYLSVSEIPLLEDAKAEVFVQRGNKSSNSFWELQKQAAFIGGTLKWTEAFRMKHIASGLFLREVNNSLELTSDVYADGTLFTLKSDAENVIPT
jgi:hypothetical protein